MRGGERMTNILADVWLWIQFLTPYIFNILLIVYLWYTNARMRKLEKKIAPFELLIKKGCRISVIRYSDKEDSPSED